MKNLNATITQCHWVKVSNSFYDLPLILKVFILCPFPPYSFSFTLFSSLSYFSIAYHVLSVTGQLPIIERSIIIFGNKTNPYPHGPLVEGEMLWSYDVEGEMLWSYDAEGEMLCSYSTMLKQWYSPALTLVVHWGFGRLNDLGNGDAHVQLGQSQLVHEVRQLWKHVVW